MAVDNLAIDNLSAGNGRVPTAQTVASLARLSIASGQIQPIVTVQSSTMGSGQFSLAPDGTIALFSNAAFQNFPFSPDVERIDTATGQATPLPLVTSILPAFGGFTRVLWLPHTHMALIATGFPQNRDLRYALIDVDHDSSTPLTLTAFPVMWSPDDKTLIVANSDPADNANGYGFQNIGVVDSGPYTLTAITFDSAWQVVKSVTLTKSAMHIPVLGFVRNP